MNRVGHLQICFFVGPSVPRAEFDAAATSIDADVVVLPPVQQGDLLRLHDDLPDIIGIIDGYFYQVPAVHHKEILSMMECGVRVLGASSLGALRAAELDVFGMEGVGKIYRLYRDGKIDGDDEVALPHTDQDDGFRPLADPLVNIRHNLRRAQAQRIISAHTAAAVLASAKGLRFPQRSYKAAVESARSDDAPGDELAALAVFFQQQAVDLKREDALMLVRAIADRVRGAQPWPAPIPVRVNRTIYLHRFEHHYRGNTVARHHVANSLVVSLQKLLSPSFPRLFSRVTQRCVALDAAREHGMQAGDEDALIAQFRRQRRLMENDAFSIWLDERCLTVGELAHWLRERDLEEQLLGTYRERLPGKKRGQLYRRIVADVSARLGMSEAALLHPLMMRPGVPWDGPLLRDLKVRDRFRPALELAGRIVEHNARFAERVPDFVLHLASSGLEKWFATRWGIDEEDLPGAILARGFINYQEFIDTARLAYVFDALAVRERALAGSV